MPDPEQHYDINKLNKIFAIASVILLMVIGWMFTADYSRGWKNYQKEFRTLEMVNTRVKYDAETNKLNADEKFKDLQAKYEATQKSHKESCPQENDLTKQIEKLTSEDALISQNFRFRKAELDSARYKFEEATHQNTRDKSAATKKFETLEKETKELSQAQENSAQRLKEKKDLLTQCNQQLKDIEVQERTLLQQKSILERKLKRVDPGAMSFTNQIADMVRNMPIIDLANPSYKIEQIVLKDITDDVVYLRVPKVDRCITCHLGIANPDYKDAPQPYRTHPNLELYLGKNSAHPMEEFGCTSCHQGRGRGTDFTSAVHTPASEEQAKEWLEKYNWHEYHHWETPMYAKPYIEAGCFKCHSGETTIKDAEKLNLGTNLIEKAGCYACHNIDRYKDWPKPGPDLTYISSKLSKEWAYRWVADPTSFRPDTWMPSYFNQSNNHDQESVARSQQEIHAIVHYLFAKSAEFPINAMPNGGDPKKGEEIVASVGCMACHKTQSDKPEPTTRQSLRREHGPNLIGLGTKTSKEWIYNWLKDPDRYHPGTRMPNLRLSDDEAADAAAYLSSEKNEKFNAITIPAVDENTVNTIVKDFLRKTSTVSQVQQEMAKMSLDDKLQLAGKNLIGQYGCFSCHNIKGFENYKPIGTDLTQEGSKPVEQLDFGFVEIEHSKDAWFTQKLKDPRIFDLGKVKAPDEKLRMPNFHFKDDEITAITTALLGFVKDKPEPSKIKPRTPENLNIEQGQKIIRQFNCQACHVIEGEGGAIQPKVAEWLVNFDNRSEDEAKAVLPSFNPPNLRGEGRKVQPAWLFNFLHQPVTIRPWLKTRMPTYKFNVAHLNALVKYFNDFDKQEFPFSDLGEIQTTPEETEAGKKLFSKDYFGCAQCHVVGTKLPAGSQDSWAPDLSLARTRLKPEWVIDWIHNPTALQPGTKMPTFYDPKNFDTAGPEDVLNGDENKQIKALRDFLFTLSSSPAEESGKTIPAVEPATGNKVSTPTQTQEEKSLSAPQGSKPEEKSETPAQQQPTTSSSPTTPAKINDKKQ